MTKKNTDEFAGSNYQEQISELKNQIDVLISIGSELSSEQDQNVLLENIVTHAKSLTHADAATLYLMTEDKRALRFEIAQTDSMNFRMGGTSGIKITWYPVKLFDEKGEPYYHMVSAYVALKGETLNFPDVYDVDGFDFSGTKMFDEKNNYRTQSMLTLPMKNHEQKIIGVLQLINAMDKDNGEVVPFSADAQKLTEALASQAAISITKNKLLDELRELLDSFIQVIAAAIDEKSPYTGGHIQRVAELTLMIAEHLGTKDSGLYKNVSYSEAEMNELRIAGWLHDIGKITTPEYVVDKATKLETIYDRIHTVKVRFELLRKETEAAHYKQLFELDSSSDNYDETVRTLQAAFEAKLEQYKDDFAFLEKINFGGEFMSPELKERVDKIAENTITMNGEAQPILDENEVLNLKIARGTLNDKERTIINNHVVMTIKMLSQLPFPENLSRVTEYAGGHHEKLDGTGYPQGLNAEQLSLPARIMAVADIFEALTAADRPYKKGKTLSEAMRIMGFMAKDNHIDPELFEVFKEDKLYLKYAQQYMKESQIDEI